ncbi:toxin HicA [Gulosibacter molinativorax]|uniref:Toxin HicA n=1 Tax=Gulosibacter molinativorax TaxID=256821 RepID=A0ABT7CAX3_9MICO|nr:toxin HicA [Gulosibacter molinativorax]
MASIEKLFKRIRENSNGVRFNDLAQVCDYYFGEPRQRGTSHRVYKMPWSGDPRVNIQDSRGKAKPYQVRQVLAALEKLEGDQS